MKKSFWFVAVSFTGECCTKAHIRAEVVLAKTKSAAKASVARKLRRRGWDTGDSVAIGVPPTAKKEDFDFLVEGS